MVAYTAEWGKLLQSHSMGKTCSKGLDRLNNSVYEKIPQGVAAGLYITIIFKFFFSETAWPIKAKFCVEPPWEVGKKVYINGTFHMTKMAAMLIYGNNLQKSSPTELIVI